MAGDHDPELLLTSMNQKWLFASSRCNYPRCQNFVRSENTQEVPAQLLPAVPTEMIKVKQKTQQSLKKCTLDAIFGANPSFSPCGEHAQPKTCCI